MLFFYQLLFTLYALGYLFASPLLLLLAWRRGVPQKIAHRIGLVFPRSCAIWVHAVSAGEVVLAERLLGLLAAGGGTTEGRVHLTTMSDSGFAMCQKLFANNSTVSFSYLPLDWFLFMAPLARRLSARRLVVIEHDFWPGMLTLAKGSGARRLALNVDFKPRDVSSYRRFPRVVPFLFRFETIFVQNAEAAAQAHQLGLEPARTIVTGNLKYRLQTDRPPLPIEVSGRRLVVFGSSHEGEEALVLDAVPGSRTNLLVIIPRHVERAAEVARRAAATRPSLLYSSCRGAAVPAECEVLVVDALGLSRAFYAHASVVLIGDTLCPSQGGHNFLEASAFGVPVLYGPYMRSFSDITPRFEEAGATRRVAAARIGDAVAELLADDAARSRMSAAALRLCSALIFDSQVVIDSILN